MEYISSDTNVWIDFSTINKIGLPFLLPCIYIMNDDTINDELLNPPHLKQDLLNLGLQSVTISTEEFRLAEKYGTYKHLTVHDRIALAIAKNRNIKLLTGDLHLRNAAKKECVTVIGTIGILDRLYADNHIDENEYNVCLTLLQKFNGGVVRLPADDIKFRLTDDGKLYVKSAYKLSK